MKYGLWPRARSISARAMATGVLPLPPAVRLPIQITGKPGSKGLVWRALKATLAPYSAPKGERSAAGAPPVRQKSGARMEQNLERIGRAADRARQCRGTACRSFTCGFRQCGVGQKFCRFARDIAAVGDAAKALRVEDG